MRNFLYYTMALVLVALQFGDKIRRARHPGRIAYVCMIERNSDMADSSAFEATNLNDHQHF